MSCCQGLPGRRQPLRHAPMALPLGWVGVLAMPVRVVAVVLPENRRVQLELETGRVRELLHKLGMSIEDAVVLRDGRPMLDDEVLGEGDEVRVLRAASGG